MIEPKHKAFLSCLDEKIAACGAEVKALELDARRDEAVFVKIRMNVYDIFRTVFTASRNQADADSFFLEKLELIPENWRASLTLALGHGNSEKAHIEQLKLAAAAEIHDLFMDLREVDA